MTQLVLTCVGSEKIEHYGEMATIFDATVATGKYAKGSNEPLATRIGENEQAKR